jgi:hypothetical protein
MVREPPALPTKHRRAEVVRALFVPEFGDEARLGDVRIVKAADLL